MLRKVDSSSAFCNKIIRLVLVLVLPLKLQFVWQQIWTTNGATRQIKKIADGEDKPAFEDL